MHNYCNRYTEGVGTIWLDDVRCTSRHVFLANCSHSGFNEINNCVHSEDVAVSCTQEEGNLLICVYPSPI